MKKGVSSTVGIVIAFILAAILVWLGINNIGKIGTTLNKAASCDTIKGIGNCIAESDCNIGITQFIMPELGSGVCGKEKVCCVNLGDTESKDPRCDGKKDGDICDSQTAPDGRKYVKKCNKALTCVTECDYCNTNRNSPDCSANINTFVTDNRNYMCVTNPTNKTSCLDMSQNTNVSLRNVLEGYCYSNTDWCCAS